MNRSFLRACALATSFLLGSVVCTRTQSLAQPLTTSRVVPGGTGCDHVIQMMLQYGVNNSIDRTVSNSMLQFAPNGTMAANDWGDLQIVQINQVPQVDAACGPKFAITVLNQSARKVCNFYVTTVAVFGHICPTSPSVTVEVQEINPGEAVEVCVVLPIEALAMGNRNGQVIGFQRIVVAIDSFDELLETNEANNIQSLDATSLTLVSTVIEQTVAPVAVTSVQNAVVQTQTATQGSAEVSVDSLDLEHPTTDSLRSAIQRLGATTTEQPVVAPNVAPANGPAVTQMPGTQMPGTQMPGTQMPVAPTSGPVSAQTAPPAATL